MIAQLPQLCPNIEELNISGARGVPSTVIMEMVLMCCMPKSLQEQLLTGGGAASMPLPAGVGDDDADGMEEDDAAAGCGAGAAAGGGMAPPTPLRRLNVKFTECVHAHAPRIVAGLPRAALLMCTAAGSRSMTWPSSTRTVRAWS